MTLFIYRIYNMQMYLPMQQKQTHRHREQICGCQGEGTMGEQWVRSLGLADANYYIEWTKSNVLLYSREKYIQYPVINHNGKEHEKEYIHKTESICYIAKGNNIVNQLYFNKIIFWKVNGYCPRDSAKLPKGRNIWTGSWQSCRSLSSGAGCRVFEEGIEYSRLHNYVKTQ